MRLIRTLFVLGILGTGAYFASQSLGLGESTADDGSDAGVDAARDRFATAGATVAPVPLDEAFRFDVTPRWVMDRWSRVSAALANLDLQGYRVPLVTGIGEADVAGALTYYFDGGQELRRITFAGTTGNAASAAVLAARFSLPRVDDANPRTVLYARRPGREAAVTGWIRVTPSAVVSASDPFRRFTLEVVLER